MINIRVEKNGELDFAKLPEGMHIFKGQEGFVEVEVDKNGNEYWNLENWFDSLDPDKDEAQQNRTIQAIKRRLNTDTGMINPPKKRTKNFFRRLNN